MGLEPIQDRTDQFFSSLSRVSGAEVAVLKRYSKPTTVPTSAQRATESTLSKREDETLAKSNRVHALSNQIIERMNFCDARIGQLVELAKRTSNFKDERRNILNLTNEVKRDMSSLNTDIQSLSHFIHSAFDQRSKQTNDCSRHLYTVLDILQHRYSQSAKRFAHACQVSTKAMQKQKESKDKFGGEAAAAKVGLDSSATTFRNVPRNRLQRMSHSQQRRPLYAGQGSRVDRAHYHQSPSLGRDGLRQRRGRGSEDRGFMAEVSQFGDDLQRQMQQQSQMQMSKQSNYNEQRAKEAQMIERTLTEISQSMTQLAEMVEEQRETIININENMEVAVDNMEGGIQQLQKYLASLSGNRWLMIKVFALIIFFAIIFAVFIA